MRRVPINADARNGHKRALSWRFKPLSVGDGGVRGAPAPGIGGRRNSDAARRSPPLALDAAAQVRQLRAASQEPPMTVELRKVETVY